MVTPRRLIAAIWISVGLALAACEVVSGSATSKSSLSDPDACTPAYESLLPAGWTFISKIALSTTGVYQCVMFYSFDKSQESRKTTPVSGMVYRIDHSRPVDIHAYPLSLPNGCHLGVHKVGAKIMDAISSLPDPELVITDTDEYGITVEASIFSWEEASQSEDSAYKSRGWFVGDGGVTVEGDKVTVLAPRLGTRSRLADRKVYRPRPLDKKSYYPKAKEGQKEDTNRLVDPETIDLVSLDMPADLAAAEYPEKLLLGFYASLPSIGSDQIKGWMSPEAWNLFSARNPGALGCLVDSQLSRVFVQDMDLNQAPGIPPHLENENKVITNTVTVTALCRLNVNGKQTDKKSVVTWPVRWEKETDRWQLQKPTAKP